MTIFFVGKDTNFIPSGRWQTSIYRQSRRIMPPCELAKIKLMMTAFIHKEIMSSTQFKHLVKSDELHEQIGSRIFFHDQIIESWIKVTDFNVVSKEMNGFTSEEKDITLKDLSTHNENIFIIYNNNYTNDGLTFNIYVYDGNFLKPSFEAQLREMSKMLLPKVYAVHSSTSVEFTHVSHHCHACSILVREAKNYTNIIDRMYDLDKRFEYITTAGGMMINQEIKRICKSHDAVKKKSYKDDACSAFSFFMALFCQIFSSAQRKKFGIFAR